MIDDLDRPIWGAREIGKVINRTRQQTFHLLEKGGLPAKKVGKLWVSTPRMLLEYLILKEDSREEREEKSAANITTRFHRRGVRKA
jgi:hypothetical protein